MSVAEPSRDEIELLLKANMELVEQKVRERSRQRHRKRLSDPYRPALEWMALVPFLTQAIAEKAKLPPAPDDVAGTFAELIRRGAVEVRQPLPMPTPREVAGPIDQRASVYTMTGHERARVLEDFRVNSAPDDADPRFGTHLRDRLAEVGGQVMAACWVVPDAPGQIRRWAALARHANEPALMVGEFNAQIDAAQTALDAAELLNWIETARPIIALMYEFDEFGMKPALERAGRRLEMVHRLQADWSHIRVLMPRAEQVRAFEALMEKPDIDPEKAPWALHFFGNAGVGKTMLMRHVTLDLAQKAGTFVARIDFDYLNPDYPRLKPGQILWAFARELRAYDETGRANLLFDKADEILRDLHRKLKDAHGDRASRRSTRDELFLNAVGTYISAFRELKLDILLIVDTCEELAKASPDPEAAENVEETFRILRALHDGPQVLIDESLPASRDDGLPGLRVIFAGRRLLASEGFGWHRQTPGGLTPRPYLRLAEIRGFTLIEAEYYLCAIRRDDEGLFLPRKGQAAESPPSGAVNAVPLDLIAPILKKTALVEGPDPSVVWDSQDSAPDERVRCNPFDLRDYAEWATAETPPTATEIEEATSGRYVEIRILRRLGHEPMATALPVLALLGHFDRETLGRIADVAAEQLDELFLKLQQQEWVSRHDVSAGVGDSGRLVLGLRPATRWRLRTYFNVNGVNLRERSSAVAAYLKEVTTSRDLGNLDWTDFDAALEVLELQDPSEAARWWQVVEHRMFRDRDADWVLRITKPITEPDGAAGERRTDTPGAPAESVLRAAVLATRASAAVHADGGRAGELWGRVESALDPYPDPVARETFRRRALAGCIAATRSEKRPPDRVSVIQLWLEVSQSVADVQLAASFVAATEAVVEYAEILAETDLAAARALIAPASGRPSTPLRLLATLPTVVEDDDIRHGDDEISGSSQPFERSPDEFLALRAFSTVLAARATVIESGPKTAESLFRDALRAASKLGSEGASFSWRDWVPPRDIQACVNLECLRGLYPAVMTNESALKLVADWKHPPTNPDRNHLESAILQVRLARQPIPEGVKDDYPLKLIDTLLQTTETRCNAHRVIAPLFATALEVQALKGHADEVLSRLEAINSRSRDYSLEVVRQAARSKARLVRLTRWRDENGTEENSLLHGPDADDWGLIWALDGLDGRKSARPFPEVPTLEPDGPPRWDWIHAIWRTRHCGEPPSASSAEAVAWAREMLETCWRTEPVPWRGLRAAFLRLSLGLDWLEAQALDGADASSVAETQSALRRLARECWDEVSHRPADELTILLRARALGLSEPRRSSPPPGETVLSPFESPSERISQFLIRLGKRQAAQIAFDEGELLALRLPAQSLVLLNEARKWYQRSGDWLGVVMAGTSQSLIEFPCGRPRSTRIRTIEQVRKAYQRLARDKEVWSAALPDWETLQKLAKSGRVNDFEALRPVVWRPWLVRIVACLINLQPGTRSRAALEEWLRDNYGSLVENRNELPADLERWASAPLPSGRANTVNLDRAVPPRPTPPAIRPTRGLEAAETPRPSESTNPRGMRGVRAKPQRQSRRLSSKTDRIDSSRLKNTWQTFLVGLVAIGIGLAGITLAAITLLKSVMALISPLASALFAYLTTTNEDTASPGGVLISTERHVNMDHVINLLFWIGCGSIGFLFSTRRNAARAWTLFSRIFTTLTELNFVEVRLKNAGKGSSPEVAVSILRWRPTFRLLVWPHLSYRSREIGFLTMPMPGTAPYRNTESGAPLRLPDEMIALARLPVSTALDVVLELDESLHAPCWEARFEQALEPPDATKSLRPIWFRRSGAGRIFRAPIPARHVAVFSLTSGDIAAVVASRGWVPLFRDQNGFMSRIIQPGPQTDKIPTIADVLAPDGDLSKIFRDLVRVLHVIGTAEETPSGTLLCMTWRPVPSSRGRTIEDAVPLRLLISAGELARLLPNLIVCVIQGEPSLERTSRIAGDRRDADAARSFAGKLYSLGIPVVVVLPPLEKELAVTMLERIATTLVDRPRHGTAALCRTVDSVRKSIRQQTEDWELSHDVCLYAPGNWDGRINAS